MEPLSLFQSYAMPSMNSQIKASDSCQLCEAAKVTVRFYEDEECWIAECESCGVPMVVWKRHGQNPPDATVKSMLAKLRLVGNEYFSGGEFFIDQKMRQIPDHFHAHARVVPSWLRELKTKSN